MSEMPKVNGEMQSRPPTTVSVADTPNPDSTWSLSNIQKLNVQELYAKQRQSMKPWLEFFNANQFKPPSNVRAGARRVLANIEYFQTNYFVVFIILSIYCVITTPTLLFVLLAMAAGFYLVDLKNRERQLSVLGRQIPVAQQYLAVACLCIPLLIMVGAGSAIFWILGASVFVIILHALFHQIHNDEAFGVQMEEV
ncbi:unnamed protein product [Didymodactylos carnosus]|uniref:PRA1 family protein n=1 Tax=Didymodactylos carnosus TaxID=1234261 RepID=A0A814BD85_9BILA|nr:unnamed protein product [Didymodactylos carnosus]CAF3704035.1 unnamed protein product [Didymodactylos carnosus]